MLTTFIFFLLYPFLWVRNFLKAQKNFPYHRWYFCEALHFLRNEFDQNSKLFQNCDNAWTSKYGVIKFWWKPMSNLIIPNHSGPTGCVAYHLYGQACKGRREQGCRRRRSESNEASASSSSAERSINNYQHALWYPNEVDRVLWNLSVAVASIYDADYRLRPIDRQTRSTNPTKPHDSDSCEACRSNACPSLLRRRTNE